jgi:hypothetical protein
MATVRSIDQYSSNDGTPSCWHSGHQIAFCAVVATLSTLLYVWLQLHGDACGGVLPVHEPLPHGSWPPLPEWGFLQRAVLTHVQPHLLVHLPHRLLSLPVRDPGGQLVRLGPLPQRWHVYTEEPGQLHVHMCTGLHGWVAHIWQAEICHYHGRQSVIVSVPAGQHCELQDHCASMPCRNGAECESLGDTYKCTCAPGFVGPSCSEDIVECKEDPCRHGSCFNTHGSYK